MLCLRLGEVEATDSDHNLDGLWGGGGKGRRTGGNKSGLPTPCVPYILSTPGAE